MSAKKNLLTNIDLLEEALRDDFVVRMEFAHPASFRCEIEDDIAVRVFGVGSTIFAAIDRAVGKLRGRFRSSDALRELYPETWRLLE